MQNIDWSVVKLAINTNSLDDLVQGSTARDTIFKILEICSDLYYNDDGTSPSPLTDAEYDTIERYAETIDPYNEFFIGVGSAIRGEKIDLPYQMGSLDQIYEGDYKKWVNKLGLKPDDIIVVSDKLDGNSNGTAYSGGRFVKAYSRGNGVQGADTSRHVRHIQHVPQQLSDNTSIMIRSELICSPANFDRLMARQQELGLRPYKNPRNMVAGLMNSESIPVDVFQYLDMVAYAIFDFVGSKTEQLELLQRHGFKVVPYTKHKVSELSDKVLERMLADRRAASEYEIDGLVLDVDDASIRARLDEEENYPLDPPYARKFKVNNYVTAVVVDVEYNLSKDGYFKPRVELEPVELLGATVTHATGVNGSFIVENSIGPGAVVNITRAGDVVPSIVSVVTPAEEPQLPLEDWIWNPTNVDMMVANAENNPVVQFARLVHFFNTIDVKHLGEGHLRTMFDIGFTTPESILLLTQEDMAGMIGKGVAKKVYANMRDKFTDISMPMLMGAHSSFGRGIGPKKMRKVWDHFKGNLKDIGSGLDDIQKIPSFQKKTANKIKEGWPKFMAFFDSVKSVVSYKQFECANVNGSLYGKTIVLTGFRDEKIQEAIERAGGKVGTSVSKNTAYVVAANPANISGKLEKAQQFGIPIISISELKQLVSTSNQPNDNLVM